MFFIPLLAIVAITIQIQVREPNSSPEDVPSILSEVQENEIEESLDDVPEWVDPAQTIDLFND